MALFQTLYRQYRMNRTKAALNALTDRQLDDIGLCRADLRISAMSAWFALDDNSKLPA